MAVLVLIVVIALKVHFLASVACVPLDSVAVPVTEVPHFMVQGWLLQIFLQSVIFDLPLGPSAAK